MTDCNVMQQIWERWQRSNRELITNIFEQKITNVIYIAILLLRNDSNCHKTMLWKNWNYLINCTNECFCSKNASSKSLFVKWKIDDNSILRSSPFTKSIQRFSNLIHISSKGIKIYLFYFTYYVSCQYFDWSNINVIC